MPLGKNNKDYITPINNRKDQLSVFRQQTRFFRGPSVARNWVGVYHNSTAQSLPDYQLQSKMALLVSGIFWLYFRAAGGSGKSVAILLMSMTSTPFIVICPIVNMKLLICAAANVLPFSQQAN